LNTHNVLRQKSADVCGKNVGLNFFLPRACVLF